MEKSSETKGKYGGFTVDSEDFYFNKSDLVVSIESRSRTPLKVDDEMRLPAYMRTYFDEISRDCCVYSMAPTAPNQLASAPYQKYDSDACFPLNEEIVRVTAEQLKAQQPSCSLNLNQQKDLPILQHYHPDYSNPPSTFKREPPEGLKKVLQEEPFHHRMLMNMGPIVMPEDGQNIPAFKPRIKFEPIFGSATIYAVVPSRKSFDVEDLVRVTEAFHFDASEQSFKDKYPEVYHGGRPDKGLSIPTATSDAALDLSACMFSIPVEYRKSDLFLVVQLSKVLTGDGDRAVAPYLRSSGIPEATKHEDSCRRLHHFRQPLAISIWKIFDDAGNMTPSPRYNMRNMLTLHFYCMRSCINDVLLKQYIREFYPKDGNPKPRLDVIDIEMNLSFYDLGNTDEVYDRLPPQLKQNYDVDHGGLSSPDSRSGHRRVPSFVSESSKGSRADAASPTPEFNFNPTSPLYEVPSQFHEPMEGSQDEFLAHVVQKAKGKAGPRRSIAHPDVLPVRKVMALDAVREFDDDFEPLHCSADHTLFLYPTAFERFNHRNLCLRVMLVELQEAVNPGDTSSLFHLPHTVLKHIYNSMAGPMFTDFANTHVTYHSKNPVLNDEIKIRLPLALTSKHYLLFEMHHVHVKPKNETRRSSISSMLGFKDTAEDSLSMKIGSAFHQVLALDKNLRTYYLPPNGDYSVIIYENIDPDDEPSVSSGSSKKRASATIEPGVVRFSIKSKSAFVSTSPEVQEFFMSQERLFNCYGGVLPSSLTPYEEQKHHIPRTKRRGVPSGAGLADMKYATCLTHLLSAPRREIKLHFQLIMRQLINTLVCGGMVFAPNFSLEDYASPLNHPAARCWSFIGLLHLFHKLEPEGNNYATAEQPGRKNSIIDAYIEYLLDEEVVWNEAEAAGSVVAHDSTDITKNMIEVVNQLRQKSVDNQLNTFSAGLGAPASTAEEEYLKIALKHGTAQVENLLLNDLFNSVVDSICDELSDIVATDKGVKVDAVCSREISASDVPIRVYRTPGEILPPSPPHVPAPHAKAPDSVGHTAILTLKDIIDGKHYSSLGCDPNWESLFSFKEEAVADDMLMDHWYPAGVVKALRPRGLTEPDYFVKNVCYQKQDELRKRTPSFLLRSDSVTGNLISPDIAERSNMLALDLLADSSSETSEVNAQTEPLTASDKRLSYQSLLSDNEVQVDIDAAIYEGTGEDEDEEKSMVKAKYAEDITLQPFMAMPHVLEGFDERKLHSEELSKRVSVDIKSLGMPAHHSNYPQQWWPYLYEVITQQWFCLLTAITQKAVTTTQDPILEEESDVEDSQDGDGDEEYAFTRDNMPALGAVPPGSSPDDMIRWIALDQGPMLLKMMMKSIAIRVARSGLRAPVMLDEDYLHLLEKLVVLITKETMSLNKGINRHSKLNAALASFLKELFGVIALVQVAQLVQAYFKTVRGNLGQRGGSVNIPDLRLKFLSTIASFDDFVGINIPLVLETMSALKSKERLVCSPLDSGSTLRWIQHPRSDWLSHLVIEEVMYIYRFEVNNINAEHLGRDVQGFRKRSLRFICNLLVRLSYDTRYQSFANRQRIAIMFSPMLRELTRETERLGSLPFDSVERKEFLVIFLYLLQNYPSNILRSEWRLFLNAQNLTRLETARKRSIDLPVADLASISESGSFCSAKGSSPLPVMKIFELMHLTLDTFEYPMKNGNAKGNPSQVLSPVLANDVDNAPGNSNNTFNKLGAEGTVDKISRLENIRQTRTKGRPADLRRKSASQAGNQSGSEFDPAPKRSWKQHATKVKAMVQTGTAGEFNIPPSTLMRASKYMSDDSAAIIFTSLMNILEEFDPRLIHDHHDIHDLRTEQTYVNNIVRHASSLCLHGLLSSQSVTTYDKIFKVARFMLSKFGARLVVSAISDTMQDWLYTLFKCCNSIYVDLRTPACSFFLQILISVSREFGSLHVISCPMLTMFGDVVETEISRGHKMTHLVSNHAQKSGSFSAASSTAPLKLSLTYINDVLSLMCDNEDADTMKKVTGLYRIKSVVSSLLTMLKAYCQLSNYFPDFNNSVTDSVGNTRGDIEHTIDLCYRTFEVFDPITLPRHSIRWLEYISRLHVLQSSMAEHAECLVRICSIYERCAPYWKHQWFPRPLIQWSQTENETLSTSPRPKVSGRNFLNVLKLAMAQKPVLAWESDTSYRSGMISVLTQAMEKYFNSRYFFLAEKTALRLLAIHRAHGEFEEMRHVYVKQAERLSNSLSFSTGNYFRVLFTGSELPGYLRDQEFIYRNADLVHVSEFQAMLKNQLADLAPGSIASVIPDSYFLSAVGTAQTSDEANCGACTSVTIVMAAVKPFPYPMNVEIGGDWSEADRRVSRRLKDGFDFEAMSRVQQFQFSVPFTKTDNKAYAKTLDKQWKRTTYLTVKDAFPFVNIRSAVVRREVRELSPIENGISDLVDCIQQMEEKINSPVLAADSSDISNLKRFIQGTVVAQVNGGAAAVAKTFLGSSNEDFVLEGFEESPVMAAEIKTRLENTIIEFLNRSRSMLERAESILLEPSSKHLSAMSIDDISKFDLPQQSPSVAASISLSNLSTKAIVSSRSSLGQVPNNGHSTPDVSGTRAPDSDAMSSMWMTEMQREFNNLMDIVYPLLPVTAKLPRKFQMLPPTIP